MEFAVINSQDERSALIHAVLEYFNGNYVENKTDNNDNTNLEKNEK